MALPDKAEQQEGVIPLCVDLDGTLVRTDTLIESALLLFKKNPLLLFLMFFWLLGGKSKLKKKISQRALPDVTSLPYNQELLVWLQLRREEGRELVLVTAANERIAEAVAGHLGIFSDVIASSATHNLSARNKRDELVSRFGHKGFDYAGNSKNDVPVWAACREAIVVNAGRATAAAARSAAQVAIEFPPAMSPVRAMLTAIRPHQWIKNVLVFVSMGIAHTYTDADLLSATVIAFVAFCLCSSATYLINDLLDLLADRGHSEKSRRPFASGSAPLIAGVLGAPVLFASALVLASSVSMQFLCVLLAYFCMTLAYSLFIKRYPLLDVLLLALLYTMRVIAGTAVAESMPSVWLVSFSLFIFTSLAMAKRYAELKSLKQEAGVWVGGRGYHVDDLSLVAQLGTASGYISILVLALYIDSPELGETYTQQNIVWLVCPLMMYWIGRIWLIASRGQLQQDPVLFASRDPVSYLVFALGTLCLWAAL